MGRRSDEDAPWLAEAGPAATTRVSKRSFFWTLLVLLALAAVAAVGLILLLSKKDGGSTQGYMNAEQAPLITAVPGPYKVPPSDPKGLAVEGQDQTMYAAGQGIDEASVIDESALPEAPLPRPGAPEPLLPETAPPPAPATAPDVSTRPQASTPPHAAPPPLAAVRPQPTAAVRPQQQPLAPAVPLARTVDPGSLPAAVAGRPVAAPPTSKAVVPPPVAKPAVPVKKSGAVQLGAFSSPEKADAAWAALAGKYDLAGKRVIAVESGGKTLYRLRAASGDSAATCARMKSAGDPCAVVE